MCKGPEVGMKLVCCNNRKKIQFGWSRVSEGQVVGDEDRGDRSRSCGALSAMGRVLAFTLSEMEPQESFEQGSNLPQVHGVP